MNTKDYFSGHSKIYAAFRPTYPKALYEFIYSHLGEKNAAWDCATGNGQVATYLAKEFKHVHATDISTQQIEQAVQASNITYQVSPAEKSDFENKQFDLITVGQALHWFDRMLFFKEAQRTLKPNGLLAVWGYANLQIDPHIDVRFNYFYENVVGPYWDNARRLVEQEYKTISFPFAEISSPKFEIQVEWDLNQFAGYLTSWSATQKFIRANGYNPVGNFIPSLKDLWKENELKSVTFPVFVRLGRNAM
jgi:ubiquinone/menaquinone biosynthesis C-methylase UbiE